MVGWPEAPDAGLPFVLHRNAAVAAWMGLPALGCGLLAGSAVAAAYGVGPGWDLPVALLAVTAVLLFVAIRGCHRTAGVWLAADDDVLWVRQAHQTVPAVRLPWEQIGEIAVEPGGWRPIAGRQRLIVVRDHAARTFTASTFLANYRADEAVRFLAHLAAGRAPVNE